jgi:hypothetical protein
MFWPCSCADYINLSTHLYSTNFTAIKSFLMAPAFLSSDEVPTSADHEDNKNLSKLTEG